MLPPISFSLFPKLNQVAHLSPPIPTPTVSRKGWFFPTNFKKRASLCFFIVVLTQELWNQYSHNSPISFPCLLFSHCFGWIGGGGRQISLTSKRLWSGADLEPTPCPATSGCTVCDTEQVRLTVPGVSASATWRHTHLLRLPDAWATNVCKARQTLNPHCKLALVWWLLLIRHGS